MLDKLVTLFLCGDVMTGRGIDQILPQPSDPHLYEIYVSDAREYVELAAQFNGSIDMPVGFTYIWGDALAELERRAPDVRIINLETAVTTSSHYVPKGINYRMHPANIACLSEAKIDCCVLANNHVLDWGYAGLDETAATLRKAGIAFAGAGSSLAEARTPAMLKVANRARIVVFSFGLESSGISWDWAATDKRAGVNLLPDLSEATVQSIADQVAQYKQEADIAVASIHWGSNWGYNINRSERNFAHALIDHANIDVVHGHSSHHVKGIEVYKEHPIIYGCGDFINDYEGIRGYEIYRDDLGLMYFLTLNLATGQLQRFEMTPTRLKKLRVNPASPQEARWLMEVLNREGKPFGTQVTISHDNRLSLRWNSR